jgi:hypothetical protein
MSQFVAASTKPALGCSLRAQVVHDLRNLVASFEPSGNHGPRRRERATRHESLFPIPFLSRRTNGASLGVS